MTNILRNNLLAAAFLSCLGAMPALAADPLPSWRDTPIKASLIDFVTRVTKEGTPDYVAPGDRVAVFDNDGTLCAEHPVYFQFAYGQDMARKEASGHPEWQTEQPFKAALENDIMALGKTDVSGLVEIVAGTNAGHTTEELRQSAADWLTNAVHPTLHRPYGELVYQPMLELMQYLRANGFKTYVVTGSVADFLRPLAAKAYGIPPEQVLGSTTNTVLKTDATTDRIEVADGVGYVNNKGNKVMTIEKALGRRPIFAFGNSDGDLDMLRLVNWGTKPHWAGIVHHTDGVREFAYDRDTEYGRLDLGLSQAAENKWWIMDMKNDWAVVFPPSRQ
jgi:phosphoserine phosphatase